MKKASLKTPIKRAFATYWWALKLNFKNAPKMSAFYLLVASVQIAANLTSYYFNAKLSANIVQVLAGSIANQRIWQTFAFAMSLNVIGYVAYRTMHIIERPIYFGTSHWATMQFARQLMTIDLKSMGEQSVRDDVNKINQAYTWKIANTSFDSLRLVHGIVNMLATIATLSILAWWITPLFALMLIPAFLYEAKMAKIGWFVWDEQNDSMHIYWNIMSKFTSMKEQFEIRALNAAPRLFGVIDNLVKKYQIRQIELVYGSNWLAGFAILAQISREIVAQGWLLLQVINKAIPLDQYFFNISLVFRLDGALYGVFGDIARMQDGLQFTTIFREFLTLKPTIIDKPNAVAIKGPKITIEFKNATFHYPNTEYKVFDNLNLKIESGDKVAIVGENGAGKSTLIKLLMRFYLLDSGEILINGVDIRDIKINSLYSQVATLFQDFNHYAMSATDNIAISGIGVDQNAVEKSAKLSGAHNLIQKLPKKYKTYLDMSFKDGVDLSGGQWQRIALARAFYRNANMIILDEPTSAIDAKAEYEIFNNIFEKHDGKTAIIVSHRFSTVRKADHIVVIDEGKIVESGTHSELVQHNSKYAEMFNKQAEGYR